MRSQRRIGRSWGRVSGKLSANGQKELKWAVTSRDSPLRDLRETAQDSEGRGFAGRACAGWGMGWLIALVAAWRKGNSVVPAKPERRPSAERYPAHRVPR